MVSLEGVIFFTYYVDFSNTVSKLGPMGCPGDPHFYLTRNQAQSLNNPLLERSIPQPREDCKSIVLHPRWSNLFHRELAVYKAIASINNSICHKVSYMCVNTDLHNFFAYLQGNRHRFIHFPYLRHLPFKHGTKHGGTWAQVPKA